MRVGIFADVSNLYYCLHKKYGRRLDYKKLINMYQDPAYAICYGAAIANQADKFKTRLLEYGYELRYKEPKVFYNGNQEIRKADWDIGICIDVIRRMARLDLVVLGSADGDLAPLLQYLKDHGVRTHVIACGISRELIEVADQCTEISEEYLE